MTRTINAIMGFCSFALIFMAVGQNDVLTAMAMLVALGVSVFIESELMGDKK